MEIVSGKGEELNSNKDNYSASLLSHQLYEAVRAENMELARQLIEAGADVNYKTPSTKYDGETCLVAAIRTNNFAVVDLLLNHGANPNVEADNLLIL